MTPTPEPVEFQYRWTNPGDMPYQPQEMLAWKPIAPEWNQTTQEKIKELLAYRFDGKPCYEVRALYAAPVAVQPSPVSEQDDPWLSRERADAFFAPNNIAKREQTP